MPPLCPLPWVDAPILVAAAMPLWPPLPLPAPGGGGGVGGGVRCRALLERRKKVGRPLREQGGGSMVGSDRLNVPAIDNSSH